MNGNNLFNDINRLTISGFQAVFSLDPERKRHSSHQSPLHQAIVSTTRTFPNEIARETEDALVRRDFAMILENSDLSKYLYFKAIQQSYHPKEASFQVTSVENTLKVGTDQTTLEQVETQIELIRKIFQKNLTSQEDFSLIASTSQNHFLLYTIKKAIAPGILREFEKFLHNAKLDESLKTNLSVLEDCRVPRQQDSLFKNIVAPALEFFASQFHVSCEKPFEKQDFFYEKTYFELTWPEKPFYIYPIAPLELSQPFNLQEITYALYKEGKQCDLILQTGKETIAFHSQVLRINGGEVMQTMLAQNMKEAQEKCIIMDDFSLDTLKTFVEYLYLGPKILEPEVFFEEEHNLEELFALAHQYQIQPMLDCCTNLFTLTYTTDQVEELTKIADLYDNSQLKALAEQYRKNSPKHMETE